MKHLLVIFLFIFTMNLSYGQPTNAGTLYSIDSVVCSSVNSGTLTLNGYVGNILRWEYSVSGGDPWTPIVNTSSTYNFTDLQNTMSFRVIVQAIGYLPSKSNNFTIKVITPSYSGDISGSNLQCINSSNFLKTENKIGKVQQWEYSNNNGISWLISPSSTDSLKIYRTFTQNVLYRVKVQNGICPISISAPFPIVVENTIIPGQISGIDSICAGSNLVNLSLNSTNGSNFSWESSSFISGPWINTNNQTVNIQLQDIQQTQFYRVKVSNQSCPIAYSAAYKVSVFSPSVGGSISGIESICENKTLPIQLNNYNGKIINWQSSTDQLNWVEIPNVLDLYTTSPLTTTTYFKVLVKNGVCPSMFSSIKPIQVESLPQPDFNFTNQCSKRNVVLQNVTTGNNNYQWFFGDGTSELVINPNHTYLQSGNYSITLKAISSNGCSDSISKLIQIFETPLVNFKTSDTLCFQDLIHFTNTSSIQNGSINSYSWNFNQIVTSSSQNPNFNQFYLGENVVKLVATSNFGCTDSIIKTIILRDKPIPNFQVHNVCYGAPSLILNQSFAGASQSNYYWSFGDGYNSNNYNPQHVYLSSGSKQIQLKIVTNFGCRDSIIKQTYINAQPVIDFTFADHCFQDSTFMYAQIDSVNQYAILWNIENGVSSTLMNPSHLFSNYGQYPVQLKVTSDSNCISTVSHAINVYPKPTANFVVQNTCANDSIHFTNLSTIPFGSFISEWNFKNGGSSTTNSPTSHYDSSGIHYPTLIVTSNQFCIDSITKPVIIYDRPTADFHFVNVCDGFPIVFTNSSSVNYGQIDNHLWDFGDNSNSTLINPSKEYLNQGTYTVRLVATSSNGCKDTTERIVSIYEAPVANFDVLNACDGQELTFNNTTILNLGMYSSTWNLGDNSILTEYAPNHLYADAGIYTVQLHIETDQGCLDSISKPVVVYPLPYLQMDFDTIYIDKGEFIELIVSGALNYTWSPSTFMDNPQISNPVVQPENSINYFVTGIDQYECISIDSVYIEVNESYNVTPYTFISPDGNGENDFWFIKNILSYPDNTISIYDEMGHEVFKKKGYDNSWNGKNKTGEILPDGMYYYIITFQNTKKTYNGSILLMRNK